MIVSYFTNYSEEVMRELQSAEACIWSLGRPASAATARVVDLGYTTHAAKIFASHAAATNSPFRFVYASGALAERDQDKGLWFMGEARRVRGEVENQLLDLQERSPGFETAIVRPWAVGAKGAGLLYAILGALDKGIRVDELARVMVDVAVSGGRTVIVTLKTLVRMLRMTNYLADNLKKSP
ncbi:hypothetical protein H2203_000471 [Taxawa tesnikishii (nom. ined.)]|nr:hypothetical protein H2203_000471 [Dothideales sp. JES 119]